MENKIKNSESLKVARRAYKERNKEILKIKNAAYRAANKEKAAISAKAWAIKNKTRIQETRKQYKLANKEAIKAKNAEYRLKTVEQRREARFKLRYGLTLLDYNVLLEQQASKCKICNLTSEQLKKPGRSKLLYVDHCHTTGKVRGLLCTHCNMSLGNFKDSQELLQSAIDYLKTHSKVINDANT